MSKVSASANSSILKAKQDWQKAYERGDQAGMNAAHDQAEKARKNGGIITVDHSIEDARRIVQNESYKANNPSYSVPAPAKIYSPPKTTSSSVTISAPAPTNSSKSSSSSSFIGPSSPSKSSSSSSPSSPIFGPPKPAAAATTDQDLNSQLVEAKKEWWNAKERNDTQAMAAAEAKGKQLRQRGAVETTAAKQLDLDNQLKDTKQQWWDAKYKGDTKAMADAEANGSQLRKQGANETAAAQKIDQDNQTKANNLNKQLEAAKQEWWNAKERNDTQAMAAAEGKGKQLRQNGAVETAAAKQLDLDNQLKDTKQQWWDAKFKGDSKGMADAEANGSQLRKQGASETAAAKKIDQDNQTKANNLNKQLEAAKQEWWDAKFKGDAQAVAAAEAKGKQLRSQGAEETAAAKQMDLDNQLNETKKAWWDAKFRHDENGMASAEAAGQKLRQQGAAESESTRKLDAANTQKSDQLNSQLVQVKDQWWEAKFRHDSKGMADAEVKAQQLRDQGAEETQAAIQRDAANREKSDKLNGQLFDLKQQWWVARNINDAQAMADVERQAKQLRDQGAEDTTASLAYDDRMNKSLVLNELIKRGGVEAEDARHLLEKMHREEQRANQRAYLNDLLHNGSAGNKAWAKTEISQMDKEDVRFNQREYLQYTVKHGTAGEAAWAKAQLSNMARQDQRENERVFLQKLMSEGGGNGEWAKENIKLLDREEARENQNEYLDTLIQNGSKGEAAWANGQKAALEREERRDSLLGKILTGSEYEQAQAKKELAQMNRQDSYSDLTERSKNNDMDGRMAQQEIQRRKQEEQLKAAYAAQMAKSKAEAAKPPINYQSTPSDATMRGYGVPNYGNSPYALGYSPYAQQQSISYTGNACGYDESMGEPSLGKQAESLVADLTPYVGNVKAAKDAATGYDSITSEKLSPLGRTFAFAGMLVPEVRALNRGKEALEIVDAAVDSAGAAKKLEKGGFVEGTDKIDYKQVFFDKHPELKGEVVVHHSVEQQVLRKPEYKGLFTEAEMHDYNNLRGIPNGINSDVHLSKVRKEWNKFYKEYPNATKEQILHQAKVIDSKYGHLFNPPIE